ncbi:MAG: DegV family EDD domain-containing protein [Clostridiales bacterium]|nr:DegV family EDD domain-containing protein [Clostridiales bacterium]
MKKLYKKLTEIIYRRDYELRERIFRMIILVGSGLAVMGIVECVLLMDVNIIIVPLFILLAVMVGEILITFKYRRIDIAAIIVGILVILMVFPTMFFLSGGLEGGATVWFALGIFYVFLMFSGKKLIFFLILSIVVDVFTYSFGYYYPELIEPMASRGAAFMDSIFSVFVVGLAGGAILKMQMKLFEIERNVAKKQQEELEKASREKNSFFASMSHEIRTPINTIIGLNEMILRESNEDGTREYARNIQSASRMLLNLVNDILDLSQVEMKKMEINPQQYNTVELFGSLIDMIRVRLSEKKLDFIVDIDENLPSVMYGDMKRVSQVILNILTNAAKYTETGSVTLSVRGETVRSNSVNSEPMNSDSAGGGTVSLRISVADTGIGIRKENLEHIFEVFRRVDANKNRKVEGSGLGLAITKQLVDLMGGEITVDSIYTKGSTFTVVLSQEIVDLTPIGNVKFLTLGKEGIDRYRQSFTAPEARVLIVDDNPMNSMVESKLLSATKVKVDVAKSGAECLEKTKRRYYHVILMDYMMPEMDGSETLKLLRKQENGLCRDSAVIALSANSAAEAEQRLLDEGFDGYLEKPIQGMALEKAVLKFIPGDIVEYRDVQQNIQDEENVQKTNHHKLKKVYITTDCVSDLSEQLLEKYDIGMLYLYIQTDKGRFVDVLEISSDNLNQYMTDSASKAEASVATVEEYEEFFAEALTHGERVIHISMAKNMGKSYEASLAASKCFDHVHVIDSGQISCGQALIVLYAAKLALEGYSAEKICTSVESMKKRVESRYIMPSAMIFAQHGFANKTVAKVCELFGFHPGFKMSQSGMVMSGIRVGRLDNAWRRFIRWHLLYKKRINTDVIYISHVCCSVDEQEQIRREALKCVPFEKVYMHRSSVSLACNAGIRTFGFAYYINAKDEALLGSDT